MTINEATIEFIGLETQYICADEIKRTRIHLDGAASPLAARAGDDIRTKLLPHYSNTHSYIHNSAHISSKAFAWAHDTVLDFVGASKSDYAAIFCGSGSTAAINRIARGLHALRPNRNTVLISSMEHHANDLPHRQFDNNCVYLPLNGDGKRAGAVDLEQLERVCAQDAERINYIAISSVSNVTGIRNSIKQVCEIAHQHNIFVLVDAAQSVAHIESKLDQQNADFWVFSGHKLYTPTAPGVMVAKREILDAMTEQDLGGGSVVDVSFFDYTLSDDSSIKEESGTPNIIGAVSLAATMNEIKTVGQDDILKREIDLTQRLIAGINRLQGYCIYGDPALPRTAAIAFNHKDIEHGLLAAILNDYFCIAVRNGCFCANPYVSDLLKEELWEIDLSEIPESEHQAVVDSKRGMVRASLSAYSNKAQIDALISALSTIEKNIDEYRQHYQMQSNGCFIHKSFEIDWRNELFNEN